MLLVLVHARFRNYLWCCRATICPGNAIPEHRRAQLAQFYDEECRRDRAVRAIRGDADFDITVEAARLNLHLLERVRAARDVSNKSVSPPSEPKPIQASLHYCMLPVCVVVSSLPVPGEEIEPKE